MARSPSEVWRDDHPWAAVYSFGLDRPPLAVACAAVALRTDLRLLYRAAAVIGRRPDGAAILDVPCGGGMALRALRPEQDVRYVAADISAPMLERTARQARRRGLGQVETVGADIGALPFADGEFDLVVSFTGLHCVPDPRAAIRELARVTRPGGDLSISLHVSDVPWHRRLNLEVGRRSGLMGPSATAREIAGWLVDHGCEVLRERRSGDFAYVEAQRRH